MELYEGYIRYLCNHRTADQHAKKYLLKVSIKYWSQKGLSLREAVETGETKRKQMIVCDTLLKLLQAQQELE